MSGNPTANESLLARVALHYHRSFCETPQGPQYLAARGLTDPDLLRALRIGYGDRSLIGLLPRDSAERDELKACGILTSSGRDAMAGCVVFPLIDPASNCVFRAIVSARSSRRCPSTCPARIGLTRSGRRRD
jgi:hypothetical protein